MWGIPRDGISTAIRGQRVPALFLLQGNTEGSLPQAHLHWHLVSPCGPQSCERLTLSFTGHTVRVAGAREVKGSMYSSVQCVSDWERCVQFLGSQLGVGWGEQELRDTHHAPGNSSLLTSPSSGAAPLPTWPTGGYREACACLVLRTDPANPGQPHSQLCKLP